MSVLVVLEQRGGKWNRMSFEVLSAGKKIATAAGLPLEAALAGSDIAALASEAAQYEVSKVHAIDHALLAAYTPDGYTSALEQLIHAQQPKYVLFPHTYQVRDFAPKLATRFGRPFVSDVIDIKTEGSSIAFVRQLFQGKLNADVQADGEPQFASI